MYKKGAALELQFSPARLNDNAGDPYWIDLTVQEAERLLGELSSFLANGVEKGAGPLVVALDRAPESDAQEAARPTRESVASSSEFKQWVCVICGWVYDEAAGDPEHGVAAGTRWRDVPDDWRCPLCDVGKDDFAMVEF